MHVGLAAGILTFVIVAGLATGGASVGHREAIDRVSTDLHVVAGTFVDRIDRSIVNRFGMVGQLASLEPLRDLWTGPPAAIRKVLEHTRDNFDHTSWTGYGNALEETRGNFGGTEWIGYATADGIVRAAAGGVYEGGSVVSEPWFKHGLVSQSVEDGTGLSPLRSVTGSPDDPHRFLDIGVPVTDRAGATIGVLGLHIGRVWAERLRNSTIGTSSAVMLGIIRSDGRAVLGDLGLSAVPQEQRVDLIARSRSEPRDVDRTGHLSGFAVSRGSFVGLGWLIIARQPASTALAPSNRVVSTIIALGFFAGIGGILGSLIMAARISRPFRTLADSAELIGSETVARLPRVRGSREAVRLSIALRSLLLRVGSAERSRAEDRDRAAGETQKYNHDLAVLRTLADVDVLTELLNRRAFMGHASKAMELFWRAHRSFVVLMIDIDHFKRVNDAWGHSAGDAVLRAVASRISSAIRPADTAARFGGEEFVVLVQEAEGSDGTQVAERVRSFISERPIDCGDTAVRVTVSIGVAVADKDDRDIQAVIERADVALYAAKDAGRDRVAVAPVGLQRKSRSA